MNKCSSDVISNNEIRNIMPIYNNKSSPQVLIPRVLIRMKYVQGHLTTSVLFPP